MSAGKFQTPIILLPQSVLAEFAVVMAIFVHLPLFGVIGLGILGAAAIVAGLPFAFLDSIRKWSVAAAWAGTLLALASPLFTPDTIIFDDYYAVLPALMAAAVLATVYGSVDNELKTNWRVLGRTWVICAGMAWLVVTSMQNQAGEFYWALLVNLALLIFCRISLRPGPVGIQAINTLLLLLIVLPAADLFTRSRSKEDMFVNPRKYYSYEDARNHPFAYGRWTRYWDEQWAAMSKQVMERAPHGPLPLRPKPGSHGKLFRSSVVINSRGFRGPEIPAEKGNTYRIVALGESTTFGLTLMPEDRPWPDVLEDLIRTRLKLKRPVEVINAGIPSYDLPANLERMQTQILPVKPDMIISYHGYNGFGLINGDLPPPIAEPPPRYYQRPLRLLGDFEYAIRLSVYKKHVVRRARAPQPPVKDPLKTKYAKNYMRLISIAHTNGIRLVLANYSMAVNSNSDPDVINFYRATSPHVNEEIKANEIHSVIISELGKLYPEIILVDTHPLLDGKHENFIDLMHFTQGGRQNMAETFFAGIKDTLAKEIGTEEAAPPR